MMIDPELSSLVDASASGDRLATGRLVEQLYDELRALAGRILRGRDHAVLQSTVLVHEGWMRIVGCDLNGAEAGRMRSRDHFLRLMATVMRSVLVDFHRAERADKRGSGGAKAALDGLSSLVAAPQESRSLDVLVLDEALTRLAADHPDLAEIEETRLFGGFTIPETATIRGVSERQVKTARAFLRRLMDPDVA